MRLQRFLYFVICLLVFSAFSNCAKRGMPTGGDLDTIPPVFINSSPENFSTNFKNEEIRIYFDEFIKLEDAQKQIIISPPIDPKPTISPQGSPKKYVTIHLGDSLKENTTYTINFGNSIIDNNEENPLPFFKYVFSTGSYIDSLNVSGSVRDAFEAETEEFISVLLYEINENYTDSIIYQEPPTYIGYTQDSTNSFQIENKIFYFLILDCFFFLMTNSIISFLKSINNFFSFSVVLIISQIILITTLYILYNNSYDYGAFFSLSLTVSFLVFCISFIYYRSSLNQMKK